jgi:hypothetical protein
MIYLIVKTNELIKQDLDLISRLMSAVEIKEYEIINIKFNRLKDKNSLHICFGHDAKLFVAGKYNVSLEKVIEINDLKALYDTPENTTSRLNTYNILRELNTHIETINNKQEILAKNILPEYKPEDLKLLKQDLINKNISSFISLDNQGNKIRINLDNTKQEKDCINISIDELLALKLINEVFHIDNQIEIVKKEKVNE